MKREAELEEYRERKVLARIQELTEERERELRLQEELRRKEELRLRRTQRLKETVAVVLRESDAKERKQYERRQKEEEKMRRVRAREQEYMESQRKLVVDWQEKKLRGEVPPRPPLEPRQEGAPQRPTPRTVVAQR